MTIEDLFKTLFSDYATVIAIAAIVVTFIAAIISATATILAPIIEFVIVRKIQAVASKPLLIDELSDISTHCRNAISVLNTVDAEHPLLPARMHFEKMRMPTGLMIFSNGFTMRLPEKIRRRLAELRFVVRDFDIELDDTIRTLHNGSRMEQPQIKRRLDYLKEKLTYSRAYVNAELKVLNGEEAELPEAPTTILLHE
ncbi:hypothetical protein GYB62_00305 [bacterium]|nr:hypothetical protein [bacterium]